jgi:hypothetical protein
MHFPSVRGVRSSDLLERGAVVARRCALGDAVSSGPTGSGRAYEMSQEVAGPAAADGVGLGDVLSNQHPQSGTNEQSGFTGSTALVRRRATDATADGTYVERISLSL